MNVAETLDTNYGELADIVDLDETDAFVHIGETTAVLDRMRCFIGLGGVRGQGTMEDLQTHHVGVVVSDLDEAVSFYRDTLGLAVAEEFTLAGDGIATAIDVDEVTGDFVHLDAGGTLVELIEYDPTGGDAAPTAINQRGAKHLGFAVNDIDAFYEDIADEVNPISPPQSIELGTKILFFRDPDGNFVEVVEA